MSFLEGFRKSYIRFRRIRKILYIGVILTMLSIGTWLILDGRIQARVSSVTFPPLITSESIDNSTTTFYFSLGLELWNPSILTRFETTPNHSFDFYPCIDVTFTNLTDYNTHVLVEHPHFQNPDDYIHLEGNMRLPMVGKEILKPGINLDTASYGMTFKESNLTRLPMGEYQLWVRFYLMLSQDVISQPVTIEVLENEIVVIHAAFSDSWGRVSLFNSCLLYYMVGSLMIVLPLVNKLEKRRKKRVLYQI